MTTDEAQTGALAGGAPCIHELFEAQVSRSPQAVAVIAGGQRVSYAALNARANGIAQALIERGVGRNDVIGLFTERSVEFVACLVGILKAGAAYLPLDPEYPAERLSFLVADSGVRLCVAPGAVIERAPPLECELLNASALAPVELNPGPSVGPDSLAYVIYTSGSTGVPKGVTLEHRGLTNLMVFTRRQMEIGPGDRVLQFASPSFDASIWELFAALISGAALVLGDRDSLMPGPGLHGLIAQKGVTIALLSPSVLRILPADGLDALRIVVAGTEKLTADIVRRWAPGRRFFNAYGPTECTIYSTILEVESIGDEAPTIGHAIPNTPIHILDDRLAPVADGESGELCIGGIGVGRGYLNRPELTAEKFVTVTLDGERPQRIYRSGDRARRLANGEIDYLGRMDLQVKIRGFRVELGEIEAVLEQHDRVASAAVIEGKDAQEQSELIAYIVASAGATLRDAELREFLARKLPAYMVPSVYVRMDRWPLTRNGKLDRAALPPPGPGDRAPADGPVSSDLSETAREVSRMCADLLGEPGVSADEDFFSLGFHSLLIAQLLWQVNESWTYTLSYSEVYEAGTIRGLAALIDERSGVAAGHGVGPIGRVDDREEPPLSFTQERVWFLEALNPGLRAYQFQAIFDIGGPLDVAALQRSLNDLVARHEILRTSFPLKDGQPVQRVHPFTAFDLPIEDLQGLGPEAARAEAHRRIEAEARIPFRPDALPLIRWTLYRISDEAHIMLHREHHFLHDGWSYGVFLEELYELYDAYSSGRRPALAEPTVRYRDFAAWQRAEFDRGAYDDQLRYWVGQLAGLPPPLRLPTDRPRDAGATREGGQLRLDIDQSLYAKLAAACAEEGVTPYMWLFAVFQLLLHRYTGETDVCVGSGFANRGLPELERMLGMVINTLAIRADFSGEPTFRDLLTRFRSTLLAASDNQDVPFEKVVQALNPDRDAPDSVLFNTFFDAYSRPYPEYSSGPVEFVREDGVGTGSAKFDLVVLVVPRPARRGAAQPDAHGQLEAVTVLWEYDAGLFDRSTAERMLGHFLTLLTASLDERDCGIGALPLGTPTETASVLSAAFRGTLSDYPRAASIPALFEQVAAARPHDTALMCGGERWSYDALNRRANRLARYLAGRGVGRETRVGVCLPRGSTLVLSLLSVLKAGGAYVPLAPDDPRARLERLVADTDMCLLLTAQALGDVVAGLPTEVVHVDEVGDAIERESEGNPETPVSAEDPAYVMYTSGSTGEPKGVCVVHRGVVRLVKQTNYVELGPDDVVAQLAPVTFDASTFEIWGALLNGAVLSILPGSTPSLRELGAFVVGEEVTTLWLTAALFNQMVEHEIECFAGVRQLLAGGEALSVAHVSRYLATLDGDRRLVNGYGPTENTTFTCCHVMRAGDTFTRSVPIGRPVSNTTVYILDRRLQPVPVGVPGELFAGGDGLARRYLNDAALTREKFVPSPFGDEGGSRLYATGDVCRWLADGSIEFIGRRDQQLKIRGYRIEPGEIESALNAHAQVADALVAAHSAPDADKRLVAYVVATADPGPAAAELRAWLENRLPGYMVPSHFQILPALPLTRSGKIDRAALPAPDDPGQHPAGPAAPTNELEERVLAIWEEVLGIEGIGVDDNFFELGGHSLLATTVINRLQMTLGIELPLRRVFERPTVRLLARELDAHPAGGSADAAAGASPGSMETGEI